MPKPGSYTKTTTKSAWQLREDERKRRQAAEQAKREREAAQAQRSNARIDAIDARDTPKATTTTVKPTPTTPAGRSELRINAIDERDAPTKVMSPADARNELRRASGLPESTVVSEETARDRLVSSIDRPSTEEDVTVDSIVNPTKKRNPGAGGQTALKPVGSVLTPAQQAQAQRSNDRINEIDKRDKYVWDIPAQLPKANDALQGDGDDWMNEAVKGAKAGDTVRVYVLHGKRYTEAELRAAGATDEIINALRGYSKAASTVQTTKAVQNWHYQTAEPTKEYLQRSFKEYEQQILTGDFENEEERKQVFERYNELQGEYFGELLQKGSDAIASEIEKTEKALAAAQKNGVGAILTEEEKREAARFNDGLPAINTAARESFLNKVSTGRQEQPAGVLENKLAGLKQIYNSSKQAELVKRIQKNGDTNLFDRWYSVVSESGQINESLALAGYGQDEEVSYWQSEGLNHEFNKLQGENSKRIARIETSIKNRGYTAEDIALYNAYRTTQDYNRDKARVNTFVNEHPVIGPLAAMGLTAGTSAIRTPLRLVSEAVTGGTGYSPVRELGGLTQEMTERAAHNIEKKLGKGVSKVYQYSVSTAESFVLGVTAGPATEVLMGLNAAVDTYDEAINRGIDKENAVALGLTAGIFEALFEHLSLDKIRFFNSTRLRGFKGYAVMLAKSAFVEGMEEVSTDLANEIADYFVAGGLSNFNTALAQGMTAGQYAKQFGLSLADSFAGGAFGGLGFGLAGSIGTAGNIVRNTSQDIAAGRTITGQGDVTALIDEARASGDAKSIKLADKLEQQLKDGKSGRKTAGQLYNRMQSGTVEQAAAQRYKEIAQEKGVSVTDQEAEDAGRGIAAWSRRNRTDRFSGEALDNEVGRQLVDEFNNGAEWFETNRGERLDFARRTGAVDDRTGREVRTAEAVARRAPDVTKAVREGDSYTLVKDGFAGQYVGKEGQRSEATLGGIDSIGEHNELMVVVDDDGKGGPHATAAFSVGEDAAEGTVQAADGDTEILYLDAQAYLTGNADMAQPEKYGADYQYRDGATMSVAAANTALATYDGRVNPDAHGYMAWWFDAHKAGKSGVGWERYLSLYNQHGAAEWSGYITEEQLAEAFRTGRMEFDPKNGVTRIGNRELTHGEGAFLQVLDYVAKKLHFAIVAADDIEGKNGFVSSRADVAVISLDADAGRFMTAAFHEIHHLISRELGKTAGRQFTSAVLDTYRTVVGKQRFNEDLAHYEELYKNEFSEEDRAWKVREEMAAQYFGNVAEDNIELLVKRIDGTGGKKLLAKVVDALKAFRDAISEALQHLAGIDPATRAAAETNAKDARKLFDRFIAAAKQTMEARETRLAEQGEVLRTAAETSAESGERGAENYSLKAVAPVEPSSDAWERTMTTEEAMRRFPNLWNVAAEESDTRNPTQVKVTVSSYRKIYDILKSERFNGTILDASSGLGYGTRAGREEYGFDVDDIEPYPGKDYRPKYKDYSALNKKYDVIISNAVLNVLPQDQRDALTVKMGEMLNDGGRLFVNVRGNDVFNASSLEVIDRDKMEVYISKSGSYQKGFTKDELKAYLKDALGDGFTVETTNKFGAVAAVVTKAERETETSSLKPADNGIAVIDTATEGLREAGQQEVGAANIDGEKTTHTFSLKSLAEGCGYAVARTEDGGVEIDEHGLVLYNQATGKRVRTKADIDINVIRHSALGRLVQASLKGDARNGSYISEADADKQYEAIRDILGMCLQCQDFNLPWEAVGSAIFSAVKSNSDKQYGKTVDFSTICRQTQQIINVISETSKQLGRGLTTTEVRRIVYEETGKAGEPTPCPVCYVFSRWMGIGGILDNMYKFQTRTNEWSKEQVEGFVRDIRSQAERFAKDNYKAAYKTDAGRWSYGKILTDMKEKAGKTIGQLQARLDTHYNSVDAIRYLESNISSAKSKKAKDTIREQIAQMRQALLTEQEIEEIENDIARLYENGDPDADVTTALSDLELYQFLLSSRYTGTRTPKYDTKYQPYTDLDTMKDAIFDLRNAETLVRDYPQLWRYRNSRGCSAGKAILPYSEAVAGEFIQALGDADIAVGETQRAKKNLWLNGTEAKAQSALDKARTKVRAQNLIGGQRYQSTSDFRHEYGLDYFMSMLEMQALGANVQLYTKVIEAVDFFASCGADVNMSVMPLGNGYDADGNLLFSPVTGINGDAAITMTKKYDNAQLILVGISDEHIRLALAGDDVTFVIPFHGSGNSVKAIQEMMNLLREDLDVTKARDYTKVQTDHERAEETYTDKALYNKHKSMRAIRAKILTGKSLSGAEMTLLKENEFLEDLYDRFRNKKRNAPEYGVVLTKDQAENIFPYEYWDKTLKIDQADKNGQRFIAYCASLGIYPRFSGITDGKGTTSDFGDFSGSKGYWKLLIDRRMYDRNGNYREQQRINVTSMNPIWLDPAWAKSEFDGVTKKDSAKDPEVTARIVRNVLERIEERNGTVRDNTETSSLKVTDEEYLAAVERGDMAAAQEMVDKAAKKAGYTVKVYRGGGRNHNVFDTQRGAGTTQYGPGTYFTDAKGLASDWARERAANGEEGYVGEYYIRDDNFFDDRNIDTAAQKWKRVEDILASYGVTEKDMKVARARGFSGIAFALQSVGKIDKGTYAAFDWDNATKVNDLLRDAGYKGIIGDFYDSTQWVIFDPSGAKSADPVTYDDDGNVIPLSERFNEEKEDIRWSKKVTDARAELAERTVGRDELGQMLDETAKFLQQARKTVDKAAYDAWIQGLRTGGRVPQRTALLKVVRQYNDPKVTGESNEALADRIVERLADMTDAEYSVDALIYTLVDAMYRRAAATEAEDTTNEARNVIREVTQGRKYYIKDGEFNYLVEHTAGTRRGMNEVFRRVYGFTLFPQSEAERRGAKDNIGSIPGELKGQSTAWQYEAGEGEGNLWAILGGSYDEDVRKDSDVSTALQLYEMRDDMLPKARTMEDDVRDRMKKEAPDAQTREQWVAETIYEEAYQDAARFAEDIIRLSPMRTLADAYEGTMEELRQAAKGVLAKRAKEIEAIAERLGAAEETLGRAGEMSEEQRKETARLERQVKNLEDQMSLARAAAEKAKAADAKEAAKLQAKADDVAAKLKEAKSALAKEKAKVKRRDKRIGTLEKQAEAHADEVRDLNNTIRSEQRKVARRDAKIVATRQYYIQKRHEETLKRADSASRKKALKKIEGQVRWLRDRFERSTTAQHIPARLRELLKPFIDAFLQEPAKDSGNTTLFTKDMIERLSLFYAGLEDGKNQDGSEKENTDSDPLFGRTQKYITDLLDELRRRLSDKKLNSRNKDERLDAVELDAISKVLDNVIKIVREENTLFVDGKRVKYHESGHAWERTIMDAKTSGKAADFKKAMNKLRTHNKFQMGMLKPIYFFNKVIGGEAEKYFNDIREAQNRWAFRVQEASQFFAKTTKQYNYFKWRDTMDSFLLDNGSAVVLTKDAVMQLYVTHEREKRSPTPTNHLFGGGMVLSDDLLKLQKKKNLTGDMKGKDYTFVTSLAQSLTLDDLQRMFSTMSKEQKDYANAVVGYMSSTVAEWGNEASREMLGFDNFTEPYYFPYVVSGSYLSSKVGQQNDIRLKNIGFTHALTQKASKPIVVAGFSDIAAKHVGSMASYSTLALPLDNLQRIRNYRDKETGETVASLMKEVYGSNDAFSYISTFLEQMNGAVRTDNTVGFLEKGLGWYKRNAVALNLSVVVQQPSAIARAMAIIPRRYFVGLPHLTEYKELKQYSGVAVVKEMGGYDTDTGRATQQYILGDFTTSQKISEKTGWLANKADEITWSQIWNAVKRETAKEMGLKYRGHHQMSEEFYRAAAKRFNDVADYSQVYDSTLSRSQFMRSKNPLAKVLTAFMAEPTTTYNMLLFGNLGEEHKAAATASIVLALLGNAILNRLLKSLVQAWRDWDDDPYWERYIKDTVQGLVGAAGSSKYAWVNSIPLFSQFLSSELNPLNDVVGVKDVISMLLGYEVDNMYFSVIGDLFNAAETAYKKIEKMGDDADWKDWIDALGPVVTKLTALTPIPLQSIFRDTWTWSRNEEQRMRNRGLEELEDYKNLLAEAKDAGSIAKGLQVIADKFGYTGFAQHMRNMLEQTFKGEWDENEQLYNAILQGDKHALEKYTRVTKEDIARYTDEANDEFLATEHAQDAKTKQYHTKIQEALRQMDDRIEEAARALLDNDLTKAQRLADAIAKDGFEVQDVYNAIHKTRNDLKPPEPYEKKEAKDAYLATYEMLQEAYEEGDLDFAAAIRNDMIVNQGKDDKDVDSKIAGYVKNEVENGEISYADARKALEDFTTLTAKDIDGKMVTYINDAFKAGEMTLAEAKKAYEDYTGYNDATVKSKLITQIGYRYANLDDMSYDEVKEMYQEIGMNEARIGSRAGTLVVNDYKAGRITDKEEAVRQYIAQSGIDDEEEARRQFDYIDFTADMPEIDLSRTDYDAWVTTVEPAGVDFDTFYTFTVETKGMSGDTAEAKHQYFADNNSKGFGIKQAQVLPVIAKLPISNTQKDEIYKAYGWSAKKLDYTPWNNPGYWSGLLD